jgi:hypothetical protein
MEREKMMTDKLIQNTNSVTEQKFGSVVENTVLSPFQQQIGDQS